MTTLRGLLLTCSVAVGLSFASTAGAVPVLWTLTDVEFDDTGTASGSFVYDADLDAFSAISVTTSGGSLPGATYTDLFDGGANDALIVEDALADQTGAPGLQLIFTSPLANAGGVVDLLLFGFPSFATFEQTCVNPTCSSATIDRVVVSGGLIGSAVVPIPAAGWLLLSAIAALGSWRRRGLTA